MRNLKLNNSDDSDSFRGKTLEEYKSDYPNLIKYYIKRHKDNDEINFIDSEIRYIKEYIRPITENHITEVEEIGELDLKKWMIELNLSSYNKIMLFLEIKKSELETTSDNIFNKTTIPENHDLSNSSTIENNITIINEPHGEMFSNNGFKLFEYILNDYVKPKNTIGRYEDLSYYYRCLFEDKFIHQKPEPFKLWFIKTYDEEFTKIKTKLQATSPQRKKDYSSALDWFNPQNK